MIDATESEIGAPPPRHEFRVFSEGPPPGWERLRREGAAEAPRTDLYLLPETPRPALLKVRDLDGAPALDLKRLIGRRGALELWRPDAPVPLPAPAGEVRALTAAAGLPPPPPGPIGVAELRALPGVRAVAVAKRRRKARIGAASAEAAELETNGRTARTVAVEAEDPEAVEAAREALGLAALPNESYGAFLRRVMAEGR